jgi:pimeloyl-ACP methyl ester carboxylesterase
MLLAREAVRHPRTTLKVALLSGLSDPSTCALTPGQRAFLGSLDAPPEARIDRNFPYLDSGEPPTAPPLWLASVRNGLQYLRASNVDVVSHARRHWHALRASADRLVIITLSCGLEILRHCIDPANDERAVHILALGPVARGLPSLPCTIVQGSRDPISSAFFRPRPSSSDRVRHITLEGLGHLDYLRHPSVRQFANELICSRTLN